MTLRHAAALALVSWYLVIPSITKDGGVDSSVRLAQWKGGKFDSAAQCEHMRDAMRRITCSRGAETICRWSLRLQRITKRSVSRTTIRASGN